MIAVTVWQNVLNAANFQGCFHGCSDRLTGCFECCRDFQGCFHDYYDSLIGCVESYNDFSRELSWFQGVWQPASSGQDWCFFRDVFIIPVGVKQGHCFINGKIKKHQWKLDKWYLWPVKIVVQRTHSVSKYGPFSIPSVFSVQILHYCIYVTSSKLKPMEPTYLNK